MQPRVGETICEQSEAGDDGGPAVAGGLEGQDVDLQRVTGRRSLHVHRPTHRIDAREVELDHRRARRLGSQLTR